MKARESAEQVAKQEVSLVADCRNTPRATAGHLPPLVVHLIQSQADLDQHEAGAVEIAHIKIYQCSW